MVASQTLRGDEQIVEYRQLWEMAKVSLPDEAVTYDVANQLGEELRKRGQYQEAKVLYLAIILPSWREGGECLGKSTRIPSCR